MEAPQNPAGVFAPEEGYGPQRRDEFIAVIETAPTALSTAIADLSEGQLDTRYRNWTIRQIVHHVADSHANAFIRFKWTLTEDRPTIKPYDETRWAALADSLTGDVWAPLAMLQGLHARWVDLMRAMTADQFTRSYFHPETGQTASLSAALCQYAWHGRHHTAQILWVRERNGW